MNILKSKELELETFYHIKDFKCKEDHILNKIYNSFYHKNDKQNFKT